MKWLIPAIIIGLVGGILDAYTGLHKVWCFLIGVGAFIMFLLIQSAIIATKIRREAKRKRAKKIWIDQNNNIVKMQ